MFYGQFEYKIDDKGRVPVPPKFRDALKGGVVLIPSQDGCITAYPPREWNALASQYANPGLSKAKMRRLSRALFALAFSTRVDNQGRIAIPAPLRVHAGIGDDAVVAGTNETFEVWDAARWEAEKSISQEELWQTIESQENRQ